MKGCLHDPTPRLIALKDVLARVEWPQETSISFALGWAAGKIAEGDYCAAFADVIVFTIVLVIIQLFRALIAVEDKAT